MKRFYIALLILCAAFITAACAGKEPGNKETLAMSELPATMTAELGERFDIPEVTATKGDKEVPVIVAVKDSQGGEVELQGRGTRFSATDINGYEMTFTAEEGEEKIVKTVNVTVRDSKGPEISLPAAAYNMTAKKEAVVAVPVATWSDKSGEVTDLGYTVMFGDREVAVTKGDGDSPDTFTVDEYGEYTVTYAAKDKYGNESRESIVIECARSVVLADFDTLDNVWADPAVSSLTDEHAVDGKALTVTTLAWQIVAVYPKYYDLSGFDKLQLTVYSNCDMDTLDEGLYLLDKKYKLAEGENIITISREDLDSQYPGGTIPSEKPQHYDRDYLWLQLKSYSDTAVVWLDNLLGIFDNYEQDEAAPTIDTRKEALHGITYVTEGKKIKVPAATAYDNSMQDIPVTYVVTNKAGEDITAAVNAGTYTALADEEYTIVYTATDAAENVGRKTVTVQVQPKVVLPDTAKADYFPEQGVAYDILQDFENGGVDYCGPQKEFTDQHVMNGETSLSLSTTGANQIAVIRLLKDGRRLTGNGWKRYEYIRLYVYCDGESARFDAYDKPYTLQAGPNILDITSGEIAALIAKSEAVYDVNGGFWFQLTDGTIYIDAIIGVYPEGYDPATAPPEEIEFYYPNGRRYDVLQSFDEAGTVDTWYVQESEGITQDHALKGNAFHVQADSVSWTVVPIMIKKDGAPLTDEAWNAYESFKMYIYSEGACAFYFCNKMYTLASGYNVLEISKADMLEQLANANCYNKESGWFTCQLHNGTNVSLYFDELIGIYPPEGQ